MELATKRLAFLWAALALGAEATLVARGWPAVLPMTLAAIVGGAALSAIDRRAVGVVLAAAYVLPALLRSLHGDVHPFHSVLWFAALYGALLPASLRSGWHLPGRWRTPLLFWLFVVAAGTPIVAARELDYNLALLPRDPGATWLLGGLPPFTVTWVLHVALTQVLGILWFDWLFGERPAISRVVAPALAGSAVVMMAVAVYQATGSMGFLNETTFGVMGRATGTMFDANLCGAIAALWIGLAVVPALTSPRWPRWCSAAGVALGWMAVLASGSRTAEVAAVVVTGFALLPFAARGDRGIGRAVWTVVLPAVGVLILGLVALGVADVGAVGRLWRSLPAATPDAWVAFAVEMWNRNGYGLASTRMIRDFPVVGVGVGSFQTLLPYYAPGLVSDNAQNWYRQQVAELGVLGAIGPLLWSWRFAVSLARTMVRRPPPAAWPLCGVLVAFGLMGLVGVPGQDLAVAVTFWTVAFWFAERTGHDDPERVPSAGTWWTVAAAVLLFAGGTTRLSVGPLRAAVRSERVGWPYTYGFYWAERGADGREYRWAQQRAIAVLTAPRRTLTLTIRVPHADVREHPVSFTARVDDREVLRRVIDSGEPVEVTVPVGENRPRVRLETWASRAVKLQGDDDRELAALVRWEFTGDENAAAAPTRDAAGAPLSVLAMVSNEFFPVRAGIPITWTVIATGGLPPYSYQFWVKEAPGAPGRMVRDWDPSNVWTWSPLRPGPHAVEVHVRNAGVALHAEAVRTTDAPITAPSTLMVLALQHGETTLRAGVPIEWSAIAAGGREPYTYEFWVFDGRAWQLGRRWDPSSTWTWTPATAGTYTVSVWVRQAGSTARLDTTGETRPFTVGAGRPAAPP